MLADKISETFMKLTNHFIEDDKTKKNKPQKEKAGELLEINYENYAKSGLILKKYKIPKLKEAAKKYRLRISGSKTVLIDRLCEYFKKSMLCIKIQRLFRGSIVRMSLLLRGIALLDRKLCTNDTDFVTMEPLNEIPNEQFYSYTDERDFTYGFNISSLIQMFKKKGKIENPYNREKIQKKIVDDIITIYKISFIIYQSFKDENEDIITSNTYRRYYSINRLQQESNNRDSEQENDYTTTPIVTNYNPRLVRYNLTENEILIYRQIQDLRTRTIPQRINELFVKMDHLGNYTQSSWFLNLEIRGYYRLYRCLYDIWNYRAEISIITKNGICPFHGPFDGVFTRPIQYNTLTLEEIRLACLIVMENLVYSGIDEDHRKLGCFHALSGLTIVSIGARNAMHWLYESVMY